jgi:hypothetical protein
MRGNRSGSGDLRLWYCSADFRIGALIQGLALVYSTPKDIGRVLVDLKTMTSHILPCYHPAGRLLERLFCCSSVVDNEATFLAAGFEIRRKQRRSLMRVATHPMLAGYVFKVFFVDEREHEREKSGGWKGFIARCNQAERIRQVIQQHRIQHFRVPRKWLFRAPYHASCGPDDQPTILIAELQDLLSQDETEHAWIHSVTESHLDELYIIINHAGGTSYRPDNIPITRQGSFAFIDTEHSSDRHDYDSIVPYLSCQMRGYWSSLISLAAVEATQRVSTLYR